MFFHEIAQELKLYMDPSGRAGEFVKKAKISPASLAKLGKGVNVTTDILVKICEELKCDISDICEIVSDDMTDDTDNG